jgi:hypothetical protein
MPQPARLAPAMPALSVRAAGPAAVRAVIGGRGLSTNPCSRRVEYCSTKCCTPQICPCWPTHILEGGNGATALGVGWAARVGPTCLHSRSRCPSWHPQA